MENVHAVFNGTFDNLENIKISPLSRAYTFSDSVYEVIPFHNAKGIAFDRHIKRLQKSCNSLSISANIDLISKEIIELINKSKFNNSFFDENIFLYLENDDICLRARKNNQKIYIVKNSLIDHLGSSSSKIKDSYEFDLLRNWHWMWSKFYYNKKHSGFLLSTIKIFPNFLSGFFCVLFFNLENLK